jgi:hypothetical protein
MYFSSTIGVTIYQVIALNGAFYILLDSFAPTSQIIVQIWVFYKLMD